MSAEGCGIKDYLESLIQQIRLAERERAAKIVEEWPVHTNYIVGKMRLEERRRLIAKAIRGE